MAVKITSKARFDTNRILEQVLPKAFDHALQTAQAKAQLLRCPEHHQGATISMQGSGTTRQMIINGCCDTFRKKVRQVVTQK